MENKQRGIHVKKMEGKCEDDRKQLKRFGNLPSAFRKCAALYKMRTLSLKRPVSRSPFLGFHCPSLVPFWQIKPQERKKRKRNDDIYNFKHFTILSLFTLVLQFNVRCSRQLRY